MTVLPRIESRISHECAIGVATAVTVIPPADADADGRFAALGQLSNQK